MRKFQLQGSLGVLAATLLTAWASVATAGDAGVVRIGDRATTGSVRVSDRPVVRGQSPVDMTEYGVQQTSLCQSCPSAPDCTDVCSSGCYQSDCPSYHGECGCSPCGCGHECPVIGWLMNACNVVHSIKCDLLTSCGIPCHCQECFVSRGCRRVKAKRLRCKSYRSRGEGFGGRVAKEREYRQRCREDRGQRFAERLAHSKLHYFFIKNPPCGHYQIVYPVDPWYGDARDAGVYAAEGYGGPMSVPLAPVIRHTFNYGWGVPSSRLTPVSHLAAAPYYGYGPPAWNSGYYSPYYASAPQQQSQAAQTAGLPAPGVN